MEPTLTQLLEKGKINLSTNDVKRYNSDCDSLMREMGTLCVKDLQKLSIRKEKYMIVFFPVDRESLLDLERKTNLLHQGEKLISPLFSINYDKDLKFSSFKKRQPSIPNTLTYMILAV